MLRFLFISHVSSSIVVNSVLVFSLFLANSVTAEVSTPNLFSKTALSVIEEMPQGGTYSTRQESFVSLDNRIKISFNKLRIDHTSKGPSFCSSATYIVFLKTLETLASKGVFKLQSKTLPWLLIKDEQSKWIQDGFGVWGRWNANGPGTAGLVYDLNLGENFSDDQFHHAQAGDFLKIFWRWGQGVGKFEKGHSVVFTKTLPLGSKAEKVEQVCFWSSHGFEDNRESGFGEKCVPRGDIQEMIFSRILRPENINLVQSPNFKMENTYLSSLLDKESTIHEARLKTGTKVLSK